MNQIIKGVGNGLLSLLTLGLSRRRENSEVTAIDLANTKEAVEILVRNIVNPLQEELERTRDMLRITRKELKEVRAQLEQLTRAEQARQ